MPTEAECQVFKQQFRDMQNHIENVHRDVSSNIQELRADFSDHVQEQFDRYADLIKAQQSNTVAVERLTESTSDLIVAWEAVIVALKALYKLGKIIIFSGAVVGGIAAIMSVI